LKRMTSICTTKEKQLELQIGDSVDVYPTIEQRHQSVKDHIKWGIAVGSS
jgi:hypothetical protein